MKRVTRKLAIALALVYAITAGCIFSSSGVYAAKKNDIYHIPAWQAIEADLVLNGSGTGYHAKLGFNNAKSAISYGVQYDAFASAPYTDKVVLMVENVYSNKPGDQVYERPKDIVLSPGQPCHLMMTLSKKGDINLYYNYEMIATYHNPHLIPKKGNISSRVEGACRLNGDRVDAEFSRIKLRYGNYVGNNYYGVSNYQSGKGIKIKGGAEADRHHVSPKVSIKGTLKLPEGQDWDSAYNDVSGVVGYVFDKPLADFEGLDY